MIDWLVVGCGFTGATAARVLAERGERVFIIDRRPHIAGNAYDYLNEDSLLVHRYGPHIFHTNSSRVFEFLSNFTEWRPYFHQVQGLIDGKYVSLPFNFNSIEQLLSPVAAKQIITALVNEYGADARIPILKLRQAPSKEIRNLADFIYKEIFLDYTVKQWGLNPEELDPTVTGRVPVLMGRNNHYFYDRYQAMPKEGYTRMFEHMLDHPNITVKTGIEWKDIDRKDAKYVIFTGPVDEYFGWKRGMLPYRSIRFDFKKEDGEFFPKDVTTVNYSVGFSHTRRTRQNRLTAGYEFPNLDIYEYPEEYQVGRNEPYYPVPTTAAKDLRERYHSLAQMERGKVFFAGRLGDYLYYNMDQACARGISLVEKEITETLATI